MRQFTAMDGPPPLTAEQVKELALREVEPPDMWSYAKNDYYSIAGALKAKYPQTIAADPRLQLALTQIAVAEAAIDGIMEERDDDHIG